MAGSLCQSKGKRSLIQEAAHAIRLMACHEAHLISVGDVNSSAEHLALFILLIVS